ncbi:hypothetical protein F4780DRAFT_192495 [Xylariomycetidae sp. FL0641]|nr:hypothetical protein F4780DRAFT_192495 [Xylariomycetidae sp. FL0641]
MTKTIVILGGAYAGVQIAHRLLKYTRPQIQDLKVILVSKNSHFYWNLAAVRAIVPGQLKEEQYALPLEPGFASYPEGSFEFIVGGAEAVDVDAKTVRVSPDAHHGGGEAAAKTLTYDHLVVATGTRAADGEVVWKANGSMEEVRATLAATHERVQAAKHIVVAGAGATGVEAAAELAFEYAKPGVEEADRKEILLLAGEGGVLGGDSLAPNAAAELRKLGVTVRAGAKVASAIPIGGGRAEILLENGDKLETDCYLPTMGVLPNTEFMPANTLTPQKFVDIDAEYRVQNAPNAWAAGDAVWKPRGSYVLTDKQAAGVAKNIDAVLREKKPTPVKTLPFEALMVATGRGRGCGRIGVVKVPSLMVYTIKGKTLGVTDLPAWVNGSKF